MHWSSVSKEKGHVITVLFALNVRKVLNGDLHILEEISRCSDEINRAGLFVALGQVEWTKEARPDCEIHFLSYSHCSRGNIDGHSNIFLSNCLTLGCDPLTVCLTIELSSRVGGVTMEMGES